MKVAIIGGGNIGMALVEGLLRSAICCANDITVTRRNNLSVSALVEKGFHATTDNAAAVKKPGLFLSACCPNSSMPCWKN